MADHCLDLETVSSTRIFKINLLKKNSTEGKQQVELLLDILEMIREFYNAKEQKGLASR